MSIVLAINGSYRDEGITDQAVEALAEVLEEAGAEVEIILLRDYPVEFCLRPCLHPDGRCCTGGVCSAR